MVKLNLRLPDDLHARLRIQAAADRRSLNAEILHLIEIGLATAAPETPHRPGGAPAIPESPRGGPDSSPA
ncbi:toxin-antitoxin system HicB family antitoxin [Streptomyces albidoflavus]|uniref:FitA-like ribbon-helix-helix domain-containing protein n=1 Tax=unclassified Streptomyces TaxID=2593676 RepID=UPI00099B5056|nr:MULTISPECIES: toxin-antitoxin system HicB family antitoxin [unclassified Streptomyces]